MCPETIHPETIRSETIRLETMCPKRIRPGRIISGRIVLVQIVLGQIVSGHHVPRKGLSLREPAHIYPHCGGYSHWSSENDSTLWQKLLNRNIQKSYNIHVQVALGKSF